MAGDCAERDYGGRLKKEWKMVSHASQGRRPVVRIHERKTWLFTSWNI